MKKRTLSVLLCVVMLLSALPFVPASFSPAVTAAAADTSALKTLVDSLPPESQWDALYLDTTGLKAAYDAAKTILAAPDRYDVENVSMATTNLQVAINALRYHTTAISVDQRAVSAEVGDTVRLTATLRPSNSSDAITWMSNNTAVSVTGNGTSCTAVVKSYTSSTVRITARSYESSSYCDLTVKNPLVEVELSQKTATAFKGQSFSLAAQAIGADRSAPVTDPVTSAAWSTSNPAVATVSNGVVSVHGEGSCTISVTLTAGGRQASAGCALTVGKINEITDLKPITVQEGGTLTLAVGTKETVRVGITPKDASIKDLTWTFSNPGVAEVVSSGVSGSEAYAEFRALSEGSTRVSYTATDGSNQNGYFNLTVSPAVTSIMVTPDKIVLMQNDMTKKLEVAVIPADAAIQMVNWTSDNKAICDVDYAGRLNPKAFGTCTITATTTDGTNLSASCSVLVTDAAKSVTIRPATLELDAADSGSALKATVRTESGFTYDAVEWVSADPSIASVDENGLVTPLRPGKTTIRAIALDGSEKDATCVVTVRAALRELQLPAFSSINVGETTTLTPSFYPAYTTEQDVKWTTSNKAVATVSAAGVVAGKSAGTCVITCTSAAHPEIKAECAVTVNVGVTGVRLSNTNITIDAGTTYTLYPTISPDNATDTSVRWTSSNTAVATVNEEGKVFANAGGRCTITCTTNNGNKTASCNVVVIEGVTGVAFSEPSHTLYTTQNYQLTATVMPASATNRNLLWESSDPKIATVNASGVVTAVGVGAAVITVTTQDGSFQDTCTISVVQKVDVSGIGIGHKAVTIAKGGSYAVDVTVYPTNASNKTILWTSNAPSVATVNSNGVIKAVSAGTAIITAVTEDGGHSDRCTVTVTQGAEGVTISPKSAKIAVGAAKTLTATVTPASASNKNVTWYSSDETIATVNRKGIVVGVKTGKCTITVITEDGDHSASVPITVYVPQAGIQLNSKKVTLAKGSKTVLTATVLPESATDKTVVWTSSDPTLCSVNDMGQLRGLKVGTAVITAATSDGKYKAKCSVDVVQLATSLILEYESLQLNVGKTKALKATLRPSSVTNNTLKWTSSDKSVATVNSKGVITAVKGGKATITCTSGDGAVQATCKVTIIQPVTQILFTAKAFNVKVGKKLTLTYNVLPSDATVGNFQWSTSNKKIAKVNQNGRVTGIAKGAAVIAARTADGSVAAKVRVNVLQGVTGLELAQTSLTVALGKTATITPIIQPENASNKKVTWASSNNDVATVNSKGVVTTKGVGYAVITAKTADGGFKKTCRVNVVRPVTKVALDHETLTMEVDARATLKATITPTNATNKDLKWTSSDKKIVKVTQTGVMRALKAGTATITVTSIDGGKRARCVVTVRRSVTGVELNRDTDVIEKGSTLALRATVSPADATNKTLKWASSNTKVATVSKKGIVTAVAPGTAKIVVKTVDGGFKQVCKVTVVVTPTGLVLNHSKAGVDVGKKLRLTAQVTPDDAAQTVTWRSADKKIATVSKTGVVTGIAAGKVKITASTPNGVKQICVVTVYQTVNKVTLNTTNAILAPQETLNLKAAVAPNNAVGSEITWKTSDAAVATVSRTGKVTAVAPGTAKITALNERSGVQAVCTVQVRIRVTAVALSKTSVTLGQGESAALTATVLPKSATEKDVTWKSADPTIATVNSKGVVTAVGGGTTKIIVTTVDSEKTAACTVKVAIPVAGITVPTATQTVYTGEKYQPNCSVVPANATNKTITYTVKDPKIATVAADGSILPQANGTTTVTAKTKDGGFEKSFLILVETKVASVKLDKATASLEVGETLQLTAAVAPETATHPELTWKSSNEEVATVDANGLVKTRTTPGTAVITATSADGKRTAKCTLFVTASVKGVSLSQLSQRLKVGETVTLNATVTPDNATNKALQWSSADDKIAFVNADGVVTAVSKGNVVVTVTTADGGFKASCVIAVTD